MSNLSIEDFTQDDLVDFQRAFQLQSKMDSSPSFREGDAEKLLEKVNIKLDDEKKRFMSSRYLAAPEAAGAGGSSERVDFLELLESMSRNLVADNTSEQELEEAFKVLKPEVTSTDEVTFSDFEKAYARMGDDFANVIALEEVKEIFEHFKVKRTASGRSINEGQQAASGSSGAEAAAEPPKDKPKEKSAKSLAPKGGSGVAGGIHGVANSKMRLKEFIKTVSQDDS